MSLWLDSKVIGLTLWKIVQREGISQAGQILAHCGEVLAREKPDRLLILGNTNSGLGAIVAARMGIPVYHSEAGKRCYDDRVPEEINRRIFDHCSNVLMPYTQRSKENLLREGIVRQRIFVIGNPIFEVLSAYSTEIEMSDVMDRLEVKPERLLFGDAPSSRERGQCQSTGRVAARPGPGGRHLR